MWKGFILGIVAIIVVAIAGGYIAVVSGMIPVNADARPSHLERWAASRALDAILKREADGLVNPLAANDVNEVAGVKLFAQHCATCHGDSSGHPTPIGFGLYQHAPSLGRRGITDDPEGDTYWMVTHGVRLTGMPSFSKTLDDTQRWQIATFLKHFDELTPGAQAAWKNVKVAVVSPDLWPPIRKRGAAPR
ncbi:MAG TPA: cytochrome c [Candidatus Baltobacteraceae bacterium]